MTGSTPLLSGMAPAVSQGFITRGQLGRGVAALMMWSWSYDVREQREAGRFQGHLTGT